MKKVEKMKKKKISRCAIYCRVSTEMQANKEYSSCQSQKEKISSYIKAHDDMKVYEVYEDAGFTGANINRPALQKLLYDVQCRKIDTIVVYKIDRFSRSPRDFYQMIEVFDKYDVGFVSITEHFDTSTPAGRLLRNIMLTFAQFERELIGERTRDKLLQRAEKGMWNGGGVPYGYKRVDKKIEINNDEAKVVKMIYEHYLENASAISIYKMLKEKRIKRIHKNKEGIILKEDFISISCITEMLRRITYTGKVKHVGKIYDGLHKAIITPEMFDRVQLLHKDKIRKFKLYKKLLFAGLVQCGECGTRLTPSFSNKYVNGKFKRYFYYRCTRTNKGWSACEIKQVSADKLDNFLIDSLDRIIKDDMYLESLIFKLNNSPENFKIKSSLKDAKSENALGACGVVGFCETENKFELNLVKSLLKKIVDVRKKSKNKEANFMMHEFIEKIVYGKEKIAVEFKYFLRHDGDIDTHECREKIRGIGEEELEFDLIGGGKEFKKSNQLKALKKGNTRIEIATCDTS
ncbi:MAG: recombinase family protein, partial [Bacteroidetes bacterium]|nr:recombinase family protein [Bacteroidota bacterium]